MSEFLDLVCESFEALGPVQARRMFGGYGLFIDGAMFGLVADESLYLKVDAYNRPDFIAANLPFFTYQRQGKQITLSFALAPEVCFDDAESAALWGGAALMAARRGQRRRRQRG